MASVTWNEYACPGVKPVIAIVPPLFAVVLTKVAFAGVKLLPVNWEPFKAGNPPEIVAVTFVHV